jgi:hypothetical protein
VAVAGARLVGHLRRPARRLGTGVCDGGYQRERTARGGALPQRRQATVACASGGNMIHWSLIAFLGRLGSCGKMKRGFMVVAAGGGDSRQEATVHFAEFSLSKEPISVGRTTASG